MVELALIIVILALLPAALRTLAAGLGAVATWADLTLSPWRVQAAVTLCGLAVLVALWWLGRGLGLLGVE